MPLSRRLYPLQTLNTLFIARRELFTSHNLSQKVSLHCHTDEHASRYDEPD
jgi:hypothetical protein